MGSSLTVTPGFSFSNFFCSPVAHVINTGPPKSWKAKVMVLVPAAWVTVPHPVVVTAKHNRIPKGRWVRTRFRITRFSRVGSEHLMVGSTPIDNYSKEHATVTVLRAYA